MEVEVVTELEVELEDNMAMLVEKVENSMVMKKQED